MNIYFDMDGTIADLYGVDNWLNDIVAYNPRPYKQAAPLYNPEVLRSFFSELKDKGHKLIIISWLSKTPTPEYNKLVRRAKREWLEKYELLEYFDHVRITPYGVKKSTTCKKYGYGILVDDELQNLNAWELGQTVNAKEKNIIKELKKILDF